MHIEKCVEGTTTYQAYGETYEQQSIFVHARPFKRSQCLCPICKQKCAMNGHKMDAESMWRAPNLNDVFAEFCKLLTPEERGKIEIVAGDGASWIDSCCREFFPNATRCIDFFHVAQWINKALDDVRISTAARARREYNKLRDEYIMAEAEAAVAAKKAKQAYDDACAELAGMPRCGRPSRRKLELISFITEYESAQASECSQARKPGRPKKVQLTPEHEASLKELADRVDGFKGVKFALGHNPENCTSQQVEKLQLIENNDPDLYRAYQLKEALRLILHMKDPEQASTT